MSEKKPTVLFLHIPKTGGTTMNDVIFQQEGTGEPTRIQHREGGAIWHSGILYHPAGFVRDLPNEFAVDLERMIRLQDVRALVGHFSFGVHEMIQGPTRYLTLLRDPLERALSLYHFQMLVQETRGTLEGVRVPEGMSIDDFHANPPYQELINGQTRRIAGDWETPPDSRSLLARATANLEKHFTGVGVTERFEESLVLFGLRLGWEQWRFSYPRNTNPGRQGKRELEQRELAMVLKRNQLDLELYRFAVDLFESRLLAYGAAFEDALADFRYQQDRWFRQCEEA